jgi:bilin biosynthesis PecE protein
MFAMTSVASSTEPILSAESAIAALAEDDDQIRYYAAWWLGKNQVQESCSALCEALRDEHYRTALGGYPLRRQAARALGQLKNPQALPALLEALNCTEDLRLREAVVQAIAAIGDSRAVPTLLELLQSDSEQPYEVLIEALGTLKAWEACSLIEPFLQHGSERVQCAAARYFYLATQEPQYIERIVQNLDHENMYLRWSAAFDLGAIGHLQAAQAIMGAKVANSLKLLNLKRILEAVLEVEGIGETGKQEKSQVLLQAIDELLIQL